MSSADYPAGKPLSNHSRLRRVARRRLTRQESLRMDRRIRQLHKAGIPGIEMARRLNAKMNLDWTIEAYQYRVKRLGLRWIPTPLIGRRHKPPEYLPEDQRTACYEDPAYEARNGIADRVVCRECFELLRNAELTHLNRHLSRHKMASDHPGNWIQPSTDWETYHLRHPGAPSITFHLTAKTWGGDVQDLMSKRADRYVTPEVRGAAASDPEYEKHNGITQYVICRIPRCGFKFKVNLYHHLRSQHGIGEVEKYRREYNWPAVQSRDALDKIAPRQKQREEERTLALAGATSGTGATAALHKAKPGPHKKIEDKEHFKVGKLIEQKVATGMELTAARRLVAKAQGITYGTAVRYHKRFRKSMRSKPPMPVTELRA